MQKEHLIFFFLILFSLITINSPNKSERKSSSKVGSVITSKDGDPEAYINILNDGPTILGSKTVFDVTVLAPQGLYLSYQWGTFIPYKWRNLKSYSYSQRLEVDWWMTTGSKSVNFYIDALKKNTSKWKRIAANTSYVEIIDYLRLNITLEQDDRIIKNKNLHTGESRFIAKIHDPSGFFKGSVPRYTWIFDDSSPTKVTTWNDVVHTFKKEGLFMVQLSAVLRKYGKLYKGDTQFYITVKAKIAGYILAWKTDGHHPTLPSKEKSLPLGPVNFQFKLVDIYSLFTDASFSYVWNYGDGTIIEDLGNATHFYKTIGNMNVAVGVSARNHGNTYHELIYKNLSIREPINDLHVNGGPKPKKNTAVQFNISCKGSAPVSFCWYVSRGSCQLPRDVICSPTRLYHKCKNTINHTFHQTGEYCVNVTVINTVSFAEKSINVQVDDEEPSNKKGKHSAVAAAAILPVIAGVLLFIALLIGVKRKMQHRRKLAKKSEVATFDFRRSHLSLDAAGSGSCCPFFLYCKGLCPSDDDLEEDHELEERRTFLEEEVGATTPKRKISYYGSIHRILGQYKIQDTQFEITKDDPSPFTPRKNLSKSV